MEEHQTPSASAEGQEKKKKKRDIGFFITMFAMIVLLLLFSTLAIVLFRANLEDKPVQLFGQYLYIQRDDSMNPSVLANDLVFFDKKENVDIEVDDVVLFRVRGNRAYSIMRVVDIKEGDIYQLLADNNQPTDSIQVEKSMIQGRLNQLIPYIGMPLMFLLMPVVYWGIIAALVMSIVALVFIRKGKS